MRLFVICGCQSRRISISKLSVQQKQQKSWKTLKNIANQSIPQLSWFTATRHNNVKVEREKPSKQKEIGNERKKNHEILCNISMERFSGRFLRLETGIPSSTRSLHSLLPGIPALRSAHIIQFPFTFQFRFGLLCLREFAKQHKKFFDF